MKETDAVVVVAFVAAMQPAQQFSKYTPDAWALVLADIPVDLETAKAAVVRLAKQKVWFSPGEIRSEILRALPPHAMKAPTPAIEAPSKFEPNEARSERIARGAALVRQALANAKRPEGCDRRDDNVPENLRKAREVAKAYKASGAYRDKSMKLGQAGGRLMNQISKQQAALSARNPKEQDR